MRELFDVLIPAHAETLGQLNNLLMGIFLQQTPGWKLNDVFLCSDNPKIFNTFSNRSQIEFVDQEPMHGKPDALNRMLARSTASYCIQNSADCLPASDRTYSYLLDPLMVPHIGAVTSHPIPYEHGFMFLPDLIWKCHSFVQPKLSAELFSFKKDLIDSLPETVIHDDAYIHNMILKKHHQIYYEPRAIVFNSAPKTFSEFYSQRKKNVVGNIQLAKEFHENPPKMLRFRFLILMSLELLANVHGRLDYAKNKIPKGLIGYSLESTKEVIQ